MKHCALITVYKDIECVNTLIRSLPKEWGVFVHIDKKSKIQVEDIESRAVVIKEKKIYWGAWEHLYVFIHMMELAMSVNANEFDYYHLLSGQDCVIASSLNNIDSILGDNGVNYLNCYSFPRRNDWWEGGYKIFKYRTLSSYGDVRTTFLRAVNKLYYFLQKYTKTTRCVPKYPLYSGSIYCSLHRDFVVWLLKDNDSITLLNDLKNSTDAEEVYLQTRIMNSPYKDKVHFGNLRYVDWNATPAPKYLDETDYDKIIQSNCLFCRKVDSKISVRLIQRLLK